MTFLFLLPLIYTVLGSVIVAIKTAKSCNHSMKIKARDERVCNIPYVRVFAVRSMGPVTASPRAPALKFSNVYFFSAHECPSCFDIGRLYFMLDTLLHISGIY